MEEAKKIYGDDPDIIHHYENTQWRSLLGFLLKLAVKLARKFKTHLHIAHISTQRELSLALQPEDEGRITLEAVIAHIAFSKEDYLTKHALIKCNPSVKTLSDRNAIRHALMDGRITTVGDGPCSTSSQPETRWMCKGNIGHADDTILSCNDVRTCW